MLSLYRLEWAPTSPQPTSCTVKRSDPDDPVKSKIPDGSQTSLNGNTTFFRNTDSYILQALSNPGSVLDAAEASKHRKYKSCCNTLDATFAALACSVSGMMSFCSTWQTMRSPHQLYNTYKTKQDAQTCSKDSNMK